MPSSRTEGREAASALESRRFGLALAALFVLVSALLLPFLFELDYPVWPWLLAGLLALLSLFAPTALAPIRKGWTWLGVQLGRLISPLVLGLVYFLLVCPTGLLLRASLRRRSFGPIDAARDSYRVDSPPLEPESMEKPF